jgi:hypothetical protein
MTVEISKGSLLLVYIKYSLHSIQLWNQLPADALGTLSCKPSNFRKRIRKVINKAK